MTTELATTVSAPLTGLPSESDWTRILQIGAALASSGLVPVKSAEAAAAIILKGAELGVPPMAAFSQISVIQGKPTVGSELQLALLGRGGVTWSWLKDGSDGEAVIQFQRPGFGHAVGRFSLEDAKAAGLAGKENWKKWPRNMLRARAISDGARQIGPDLLNGASYTYEEMGQPVDEDGRPVAGVEFTVEADAPVEDALPQPDADDAERKALWKELKALKAALLDEDRYYQILAADHGVSRQTTAGEIDTDTLRAIIQSLTEELAVTQEAS